MIPIQQLLNKIQWDREFGRARFEIGYLDHVEQRIIRIPLTRIHFEHGNRFFFQLEDEMGEAMEIPFHRIRQVYRNGTLVWHRTG